MGLETRPEAKAAPAFDTRADGGVSTSQAFVDRSAVVGGGQR